LSDSPFDADIHQPVGGFADLTDITYHRHVEDAMVRVAFNRPGVDMSMPTTTPTSHITPPPGA
jgi:1,4-dihydroxy-2-naphthoyl-CoA synthase